MEVAVVVFLPQLLLLLLLSLVMGMLKARRRT